MVANIAIRPVTKSYRQLVTKFPLRHIRTEEEYKAALAVAEKLMTVDLDEGGRDYLDLLADVIETYESKTHPIPDASEAEVLRLLMNDRKLTQPQLAKESGIAQSTLSAVLTGGRSLTKSQVVTLANFFHVSPAVFLPRESK